MTRNRAVSDNLLVAGFLIVTLADLVLAFLVVHDRWFFEEPVHGFLLTVLDAATQRIGQVIVILSILVGLYVGAIPSSEALGQRFVTVLRLVIHEGLFSVAFLGVLTASAAVLTYLFFTGVRFFPLISQGSSSVLITPDGAELYVAREAAGVVAWQTLQAPHAESEVIPIGQCASGDRLACIHIGQETAALWAPGQPAQLAYVPQTDQILVTDLRFNSVVVISRRTHTPVSIIAGVGFAPRCIVVTPDGHKAYVGSEQPIPTGRIAVIDLRATPYPQLQANTIDVPSPQGMAIKGRRLYVATQSGAGRDAVFVVDTSSDRVVTWIPGFAIGIKAAVVGEGAKTLYVSRGHSLGVLDISGRKLEPRKSIPLDTSTTAIAVTEDGGTALVANGRRLTAIDTSGEKLLASVDLPAPATGMAISRNRAYAWIPEVGQLFTFDIRSLMPGAQP